MIECEATIAKEREEKLGPETAAQRLRDIWLRFYSKPLNQRTKDDKRVHELAMEEFKNNRTLEIDSYLDEKIDFDDGLYVKPITRGQQIQLSAQREAIGIIDRKQLEERRQQEEQARIRAEQKRIRKNKSQGARRYERRIKAEERRGTPPESIH